VADVSVVLDGLAFPEGPRWHDGRLWFSDMHAHEVVALDVGTGERETIVEVPACPSGLGWLPDGTMLVVSMEDRRLLRFDGSLHEHADLSGIATFHCNDMVVDWQGRAFVGNFGFDLHQRAEPTPATLARVDPDGSVHAVADDLQFPNGSVIYDTTLVVGESWGGRLTAFDIGDDGSLSNRRVWAQLEGAVPDGICLDADGAIWVASPLSNEVLRVREGGEVTDRVDVGRGAFACMLGGDDRRTLLVCTAESSDPVESARLRTGRIEALRVDVPGAGLP
jgi:sugar lactone lactonase YvrE